MSGDVQAASREMAAAILVRKGLVPSSLKQVRQAERSGSEGGFARFERVGLDELILFTSQFATMFKAGLPVLQCLGGLLKENKNRRFSRILTDVKSRVEDGSSLNEALRRHPQVFSRAYANMVMAGEVSGTLDISLRRLAELLQKQYEANNRITEVTRYPKMVIGAVVIAVSVLMVFVVPKFITIFQAAGLVLPLPTKILIVVNQLFRRYWYIWLGTAIGGWYAFNAYIRSRKGRYQWHRFVVHAPIFGDIMLKLALGQFCNVLSVLIGSGIPILEAIEVAGRVTDNDYLMKIFTAVKRSVHEGSGMASKLAEHKIVPGIAVQMISVGESVGALDSMLMEVAAFFSAEADRKIKNLSSLVEPVMLLVLGSIVLFIALSIFLPMWDMTRMGGGR